MAIKDLLVAYDGRDASERALEMALQMAKKYDAVLTGLNVTQAERFDGHVRRWISKETTEALTQARLDATSEIGEKFKEQVKAAGFTGQCNWLVEEGPTDLTIARSARFFDVLLIGQFVTAFDSNRRSVSPPAGLNNEPDRAVIADPRLTVLNQMYAQFSSQSEDLLLRAGTPIIVVPKCYEPKPFKEEAALAWDGSRFAARALTDAMQILETKKRIEVLSVSGDTFAEEIAKMPGLDILYHLQRHGIEAEKVTLQPAASGRNKVGEAILNHCTETQPDILVMGAYGRGSFGQQVFGGVTRFILQNQTVPVLLSH